MNERETSLYKEEEIQAEEDGCVLEVTELQVRVLIYRIMQSEWFSHSDVRHSAGQAAYWAPPHQGQLQHTQPGPPATGVPEILDDLAELITESSPPANQLATQGPVPYTPLTLPTIHPV